MTLAKGAESSRTSLPGKQHQLSGHNSQKLKYEDCGMTACGKNLLPAGKKRNCMAETSQPDTAAGACY